MQSRGENPAAGMQSSSGTMSAILTKEHQSPRRHRRRREDQLTNKFQSKNNNIIFRSLFRSRVKDVMSKDAAMNVLGLAMTTEGLKARHSSIKFSPKYIINDYLFQVKSKKP